MSSTQITLIKRQPNVLKKAINKLNFPLTIRVYSTSKDFNKIKNGSLLTILDSHIVENLVCISENLQVEYIPIETSTSVLFTPIDGSILNDYPTVADLKANIKQYNIEWVVITSPFVHESLFYEVGQTLQVLSHSRWKSIRKRSEDGLHFIVHPLQEIKYLPSHIKGFFRKCGSLYASKNRSLKDIAKNEVLPYLIKFPYLSEEEEDVHNLSKQTFYVGEKYSTEVLIAVQQNRNTFEVHTFPSDVYIDFEVLTEEIPIDKLQECNINLIKETMIYNDLIHAARNYQVTTYDEIGIELGLKQIDGKDRKLSIVSNPVCGIYSVVEDDLITKASTVLRSNRSSHVSCGKDDEVDVDYENFKRNKARSRDENHDYAEIDLDSERNVNIFSSSASSIADDVRESETNESNSLSSKTDFNRIDNNSSFLLEERFKQDSFGYTKIRAPQVDGKPKMFVKYGSIMSNLNNKENKDISILTNNNEISTLLASNYISYGPSVYCSNSVSLQSSQFDTDVCINSNIIINKSSNTSFQTLNRQSKSPNIIRKKLNKEITNMHNNQTEDERNTQTMFPNKETTILNKYRLFPNMDINRTNVPIKEINEEQSLNKETSKMEDFLSNDVVVSNKETICSNKDTSFPYKEKIITNVPTKEMKIPNMDIVNTNTKILYPVNFINEPKVLPNVQEKEKETNTHDICLLTVKQVPELLITNKMIAHIKTFKENQIDGDLLTALDEKDLQELGLSPFEAKKLYCYINGWRPLRNNEMFCDNKDAVSWSIEDLSVHLKYILLHSLAEFTLTNDVDGALMIELLDHHLLNALILPNGNTLKGFELIKLTKYVFQGYRPSL